MHNAYDLLISESLYIKIVLTLIIFFFNDTATNEIYTLSLHDALPISPDSSWARRWRPNQAVWKISVKPAPSSNDIASGILWTLAGTASESSAYPPRVRPPLSSSAVTRSPALKPADLGALSTTPLTSAPGTKGRSGLTWYWPATMRASK